MSATDAYDEAGRILDARTERDEADLAARDKVPHKREDRDVQAEAEAKAARVLPKRPGVWWARYRDGEPEIVHVFEAGDNECGFPEELVYIALNDGETRWVGADFEHHTWLLELPEPAELARLAAKAKLLDRFVDHLRVDHAKRYRDHSLDDFVREYPEEDAATQALYLDLLTACPAPARIAPSPEESREALRLREPLGGTQDPRGSDPESGT